MPVNLNSNVYPHQGKYKSVPSFILNKVHMRDVPFSISKNCMSTSFIEKKSITKGGSNLHVGQDKASCFKIILLLSFFLFQTSRHCCGGMDLTSTGEYVNSKAPCFGDQFTGSLLWLIHMKQ